MAAEKKQRTENRVRKLVYTKRIACVKKKKDVYAKRKECIKKKTMELSTLCDIKACAIIFGPDGNVVTWPENQSEVKGILENYRDLKKNCPKRVIIEEGLLEKKLPKSISDEEFVCGLSEDSLREFLKKIESKIESVKRRVEVLKTEKNGGIKQETEESSDNNSNNLFDAFIGEFSQTVGGGTNPSIDHQIDQYFFNPDLSHNNNFVHDYDQTVGSDEQVFHPGQINFDEFTEEFHQTVGGLPIIYEGDQFIFNPPQFSFNEFTEDFDQTLAGIPNTTRFIKINRYLLQRFLH